MVDKISPAQLKAYLEAADENQGITRVVARRQPGTEVGDAAAGRGAVKGKAEGPGSRFTHPQLWATLPRVRARNDMRRAILILSTILLPVGAGYAQQAPLGPGISGGIGSGVSSGLNGGIGGGLESGLGIGDSGAPGPDALPPTARTLADPFNPDKVSGGGGCAPSRADIDHTGCKPVQWIKGLTPNPKRVQTYSGNSAFDARAGSDPNRVETYSGNCAFADPE